MRYALMDDSGGKIFESDSKSDLFEKMLRADKEVIEGRMPPLRIFKQVKVYDVENRTKIDLSNLRNQDTVETKWREI